MTNYEFYKEEIEMRYRNGESFALTKQGCVVNCSSIDCSVCMFSASCNPDTYNLLCGDRKMVWAVQEHIEKPKLTNREKQFCELFGYKDVWFARDRTGELFMYVSEFPYRSNDGECWYTEGSMMQMDIFGDVLFSFIKWEDEEPWSIEELLKLEVVE